MELVLAVSVSLMAVLVTFLAIITGRQQKEIESLWKQIRDINEHLIQAISHSIKSDEGTRATFEIQNEINEAFLKMLEEKNG